MYNVNDILDQQVKNKILNDTTKKSDLTALDPVAVKTPDGETIFIDSPLLSNSKMLSEIVSRIAKCIHTEDGKTYIYVSDGKSTQKIQMVFTKSELEKYNTNELKIRATLANNFFPYAYREKYFRNPQKKFNNDNEDWEAYEVALKNNLLITVDDVIDNIKNSTTNDGIIYIPYGYFYVGEKKSNGDNFNKTSPDDGNGETDNSWLYWFLGVLGVVALISLFRGDKQETEKTKAK